jgi:hypothetical protein
VNKNPKFELLQACELLRGGFACSLPLSKRDAVSVFECWK